MLFGAGVLVGAALMAIVWVVQVGARLVVYGCRPPKQGDEGALAAGLELLPQPLTVILSPVAMLGVVALEEFVFRALLLGWLRGKIGVLAAIVISAAIFGLVHALNERPPRISLATVGAVAAGVALGAAYVASGSLAHAIGVHFGWNYVQWSVFGYPLYGFGVEGLLVTRPAAGKPEWLTGGRMGAEASVLSVVMMLVAAGVYAFWLGT